MRNITMAKTAGFCFGVNKAVALVRDLLDRGEKVCTLGPIIHNPQVVSRLEARGVRIVSSPSEVPPGAVLVFRSHGVPKEIADEARQTGARVVDATCPFVAKIHRLVREHTRNGAVALIAGDPAHPEVIGIRGHCAGPSFVFSSADELRELFATRDILRDSAQTPVVMVAQTTLNAEIWKECVNFAKNHCTNLSAFDTICDATAKRQEEAARLSSESDLMVIVGGRQSSNTAKLRDVCARHCRTVLVETAAELSAGMLAGAERIGLTAGASTPDDMIKEVLTTMTDIINNENTQTQPEAAAQTAAEPTAVPEETFVPEEAAAASVETASPEEAAVSEEPQAPEETAVSEETAAPEEAPVPEEPVASGETPAPEETAAEPQPKSMDDMTFEEALEVSLKNLSTDERVHGIVVSIAPNEVQVEVVGRKQTGYIPAEELSSDPNVAPEDVVKVGDELELLIMRTNDQEGTIMLSKKRIDSLKGWDTVVAAEKSGEVLEGTVTDIIKGGMLVTVCGVRVFVPASQASLNRMEDLSPLKGTKVRLRIIEVNLNRHRAVGSVRSVAREERKEKEAAFWAQAAVGQKYTGVVKSLTSYGAFVDLGGVDGMIHISELSWSRIRHPSDVVSVGDTVDVYIRDLDTEKKKISLGYRKAEDNPWEQFKVKFHIGDVVEAKIVGMTSFGAFAQLLPGVDGLIHISQIVNHRVEKPQDELSIGQIVRVKITNIDYDNKRISLSMRALIEEEESAPAPAEESAEED